MALILDCPHCLTRMSYAEEHAGLTFQCPGCKNHVTAPAQQFPSTPVPGPPVPAAKAPSKKVAPPPSNKTPAAKPPAPAAPAPAAGAGAASFDFAALAPPARGEVAARDRPTAAQTRKLAWGTLLALAGSFLIFTTVLGAAAVHLYGIWYGDPRSPDEKALLATWESFCAGGRYETDLPLLPNVARYAANFFLVVWTALTALGFILSAGAARSLVGKLAPWAAVLFLFLALLTAESVQLVAWLGPQRPTTDGIDLNEITPVYYGSRIVLVALFATAYGLALLAALLYGGFLIGVARRVKRRGVTTAVVLLLLWVFGGSGLLFGVKFLADWGIATSFARATEPKQMENMVRLAEVSNVAALAGWAFICLVAWVWFAVLRSVLVRAVRRVAAPAA